MEANEMFAQMIDADEMIEAIVMIDENHGELESEIHVSGGEDEDIHETPPKRLKGRCGKAIVSQTRRAIIEFATNLEGTTDENGIKLTKNDIAQKATVAFGITRSTFYRIMAEGKLAKETGDPIVTPGQKRNRPCIMCDTFDSYMKDALRRKIYMLYTQHVYPTIDNLLKFSQDELGFEGKRKTFVVILKKMGFQFKKFNGRFFLLEKHDVKLQRYVFLSKWKKYKEEGRFLVYLDETSVWQNTIPSKILQSSDDDSQKAPSGKGRRIILLHAGGVSGSIPNCLHTFVSNPGLVDHHSGKNNQIFQEWFRDKLLKNIPPRSVIVLDNAPCHSMLLEKPPSENTRKTVMVEWLLKNGIHVDEHSMSKVQMYEIIRKQKPASKRYVIDEMAREAGHIVIRLPPDHCLFNPMEYIWDIVKLQIAKRNKSFKMADVLNLTRECATEIGADVWSTCIKKADEVCDEYWKLDPIVEMHVEEMIIETGAMCSDGSEDEMENL